MRLIAPDAYRRMPWKNGGGVTYEIAVAPAGSDWSAFAWRVSLAEVNEDGPFSPFPGVDRTLVVLEGNGVRLSGVGPLAVELRCHDRADFAGEAAVDCALIDGPVRDLNVMTRRGRASSRVRILRTPEAWTSRSTYVCHAARRGCVCMVDTSRVEVREHHTLVAEATRLAVEPGDDAVAVVASIAP
jgi:hypothetical protein